MKIEGKGVISQTDDAQIKNRYWEVVMSLNSPLDWMVYEERNQEMQRRAETAAYRRQALLKPLQPRLGPKVYRAALVYLGKVMVNWGEKLQSRYGRINEHLKEIKEININPNTERKIAHS